MVTPFGIWIMASIAILSLMIGFWTGRGLRWRREEMLEEIAQGHEGGRIRLETPQDLEEEERQSHFQDKTADRQSRTTGAAIAGRKWFTRSSDHHTESSLNGKESSYQKESNQKDRRTNQAVGKRYQQHDQETAIEWSIREERNWFRGYPGENEGISSNSPSQDSRRQEELQKGNTTEEKQTPVKPYNKRIDGGRERLDREIKWKEIGMEHKRIPIGWPVGSPVAGAVSFFYEGKRRGAVIIPEQGYLYAPAPGKIVKLYPTGNAFLLRTDYGVELLIRVGVETQELEGMYFRPRVVQNEIVNKGKLLLEFDPEGIGAEGYDCGVRLSVEENHDWLEISITQAEHVKVGEELLWIKSVD